MFSSESSLLPDGVFGGDAKTQGKPVNEKPSGMLSLSCSGVQGGVDCGSE